MSKSSSMNSLDLLTEFGTAAALQYLVDRRAAAAESTHADHIYAAFSRSLAGPLARRRLSRCARLAELQGLVLSLRVCRSRLEPKLLNPAEVRRLATASQVFEAMIQGEPMQATSLAGSFPRWSEVGPTGWTSKSALSHPAAWRHMAEDVARSELELALAPLPPPQVVLDVIFPTSGQHPPIWFEAFAMAWAWQLHCRPDLIPQFASEVDVNSGRPMLEALVDGGREIAETYALQLQPDDETFAAHAPAHLDISPSQSPEPPIALQAAHFASAALQCSYSRLAALAGELATSPRCGPNVGHLLREMARLLVDVATDWQSSNHALLSEAAASLRNDAWHEIQAPIERFARAAAAPRESGGFHPSPRIASADLDLLQGSYLAAAEAYRRIDGESSLDAASRMRVMGRLADALYFAAHTTGGTEHWKLASEVCQRTFDAAIDTGAWREACRAACKEARLALSDPAKASPARLKSTVLQATAALAMPRPPQLEQTALELELARLLVLLRLAELEKKESATHITEARQLAAALQDAMPGADTQWLAKLIVGITALVLAIEAQNDTVSHSDQEMLTILADAFDDDLASIDPGLAAMGNSQLAMLHERLGKVDQPKAHAEAAALALTRSIGGFGAGGERVRIAQKLSEHLVSTARGPIAAHRLLQARDTLVIAENSCPAGHSDERGFTCMSRANIYSRLRKITGERTFLESALSDADEAIANYKGINGPFRVFLAMRAKANALFDAARDGEIELIEEAEALLVEVTGKAEAYRIPLRDQCLAHLSIGEMTSTAAEHGLDDQPPTSGPGGMLVHGASFG